MCIFGHICGTCAWGRKKCCRRKKQAGTFYTLRQYRDLDFDVDAANCYGKIRAGLEKKGTQIGPLDMMIAGHAMSKGDIVVTNNVKEFSRVRDLKIENWAE